jgi:hypothetical protein
MSTVSAGDKKVSVSKLKITKEIPGWSESKSETKIFKSQELFDIINGGATEYTERGLIEGIHQRLTNKDGGDLELFVEDFGSSQNAQKMYLYKKESYTEKEFFPGNDSTNIFVYKVLAGHYVFTFVDRFYIEILGTGIPQKEIALKQIASVINHYKKVTSK